MVWGTKISHATWCGKKTKKQKNKKLVAEMQEVSEKVIRSSLGSIHSLSQDIFIYCLLFTNCNTLHPGGKIKSKQTHVVPDPMRLAFFQRIKAMNKL